MYHTPPHGSPKRNEPRRRASCLRDVTRALDGAGVVWAVRGAPGELMRWCRARSPKDLDLWAPHDDSASILRVLLDCGGVPTCTRGGIAGRAGIVSAMFMFMTEEGWPIGTLDVSFGPPRAGVIELGDEREHARQVERVAGVPRFVGTATITELILRRCLRGKDPDPIHTRYVKRCWRELKETEQSRFVSSIWTRFGAATAECLIGILSQERSELPWNALRRHLISGSLRAKPALLIEYAIDKALFDKRPRARERYAAGSRPSGTTIAILGTDGTGKSSLVAALASRLRNFGLDSRSLYFGRVRGSMLITDSRRRSLERLVGATSIADNTRTSDRRISPAQRLLRYAASYVYVLDYGGRLLLRVLPLWAKGNVIIMDRYVYDLRIMPYASALAARLAELISPPPRLLLFLDPDPRTIAARRQERTPAEIARQQEVLRATCERLGTSTRYIRVTSSATVDELAKELSRAAIAVAHRREIGVTSVLTALLDDVQRRLQMVREHPSPMPGSSTPHA